MSKEEEGRRQRLCLLVSRPLLSSSHLLAGVREGVSTVPKACSALMLELVLSQPPHCVVGMESVEQSMQNERERFLSPFVILCPRCVRLFGRGRLCTVLSGPVCVRQRWENS